MKIPFISIKSVLYDLKTVIPEEHWNETHMLEWATKAAHKVAAHSKLEQGIAFIPIVSHRAFLPTDLKYITQIAYKDDISQEDIDYFKWVMNLQNELDNPAINHMANPEGLPSSAADAISNYARNNWQPLRLSTNTFALAIHCGEVLPCVNCQHEYTVDSDMTITTTLKEGILLLSYLRYPKNEHGDILIPDDEDLKEAIFHFCMYRYFLVKDIMKEQGAAQRMQFHLERFGLLKTKAAGKLNAPTLDQMENIKDMTNRLVPRTNRYDKFFSELAKRENHNFSRSGQTYRRPWT